MRMQNSTEPKHVIFLVLDTHRYDRLGCYGYGRGTSPNIDSFARTATLYEHAISPAQWTIPAHASMFTGEYPTTHLTNQSRQILDDHFLTLAQILQDQAYTCVGFCNNPLVGVLDNGLRRGFDIFYNYGGAVPSTPARETSRLVNPLSQLWERYTQLLRRLSYPIQNAIARSDDILHFTLNPLLVPLWTRFANFKGATADSIHDATSYVKKHFLKAGGSAQFLFVNLMETHLPFQPPNNFVARYAPILLEERAASDFMRVYNTQALRWLLPMDEPFSGLEAQTLSAMYDAEVAYQDHLLGEFFEVLDRPEIRENSLVVIVADHGEMLGEHQLMGHSLGVYQELVRVPLIIRYPGQSVGQVKRDMVSTASLFQTVLAFTGGDQAVEEAQMKSGRPAKNLSPALGDGDAFVISEAYPPMNVIKIMESGDRELIAKFHCRAIHRAVYGQDRHKLISIEGGREELFDLAADPQELSPIIPGEATMTKENLIAIRERFLPLATGLRPANWTRKELPDLDESVAQRLRGLGYLE